MVLLAAAAVLAAGAARADGEVEDGKKVFAKCKACHLADSSGKNTIGPNLRGVVGRKAGTVETFKYSPSMQQSGLTWDDETLHKYLADPKTVVPGTKMIFAGLKNQKELDDVIAYLKTEK
jgi:cytochrome c